MNAAGNTTRLCVLMVKRLRPLRISGPRITGSRHAGSLRLGQVLGLQQSHEEEVFPAVWVQPGFTADPLLAETTGQVAVDGAAIAGQHLQLVAVRTELAEGPGHNEPGYLPAQPLAAQAGGEQAHRVGDAMLIGRASS